MRMIAAAPTVKRGVVRSAGGMDHCRTRHYRRHPAQDSTANSEPNRTQPLEPQNLGTSGLI